MTIGETLKRARKKMNLELDEVAEATKIAKMFLIALESDDIESLPSGVYARNFLRTYAKFLSLDEDIITAEYHEQFNVVPHFVAQQEQTKQDDFRFKRQKRRTAVILLIVILVLSVVGYVSWYVYQTGGFSMMGGDTPPSESAALDVAPATPTPVTAEPQLTVEDDPPVERSSVQATPPVEAGESTQTAESQPEMIVDENETATSENGAEPFADSNTPEPDSGDQESLDDQEAFGDAPAAVAVPQQLPLRSVEGLTPVNGGEINDLRQVFIVEALEQVRIQVMVDETVVTARTLFAGDVRVFRYGTMNGLVIDLSKVALQEGDRFLAQGFDQSVEVSASFGPGQLIDALDARLRERGYGGIED